MGTRTVDFAGNPIDPNGDGPGDTAPDPTQAEIDAQRSKISGVPISQLNGPVKLGDALPVAPTTQNTLPTADAPGGSASGPIRTTPTTPTTQPPLSGGPSATPNNPTPAPTPAPTPFQTTDPLAFMPLPVATSQMSPGTTPSTPSPVPSTPNAPTATTTAPTPPAHWSASDPRTQTEILQQDYNGDMNAFLAASPSGAVSGTATDPAYQAAMNAGNWIGFSPLGGNGSQINSAGQTVAGPDAHLAQVAAAPTTAAGFNVPGLPGYSPTDANGLPSASSGASGNAFTPSLPTPAPVNVPAPIQAPIPANFPWETPPTTGATLPPSATPSVPAVTPSATPAPSVTPSVTPGASSPSAPSTTTPSPATSTVSPTSVPTQSATTAPSTDANGLPTSSGAMSAVALTPTTPQNALTNMTISPGQLADRYGTALTQYNDWQRQTDPQFQAAERDRLRYAAANGTIGAGSTATSINDIAAQREADMRTKRDAFLGTALNNSIDDAYKNVGIAQQQQQFQQGQQNTAFGQQVTLQQLSDSELGQQFQQLMTTLGFNSQQQQQAFENAYKVQQLSDDETGQAFYRALQQFLAGNSGDPAQILAWISGQYAKSPNYSAAA